MTRREAIDACKATIVAHIAQPYAGRMRGHLVVACFFRGGRFVDNGSGTSNNRILSLAIQELRDAGEIVANVRHQWRLATGGAT